LRALLDKTIDHLSPKYLFPKTTKVYFNPQEQVCPDCKHQLKVMKTVTKTIITLHIGKFNAHMTSLFCPYCDNKQIYIPCEPQTLVPPFCNVGYDVLIYVGRQVYENYRTAKEISTALQQRNIFLSDSEIYFLAKKFLTYLEVAHQQSYPDIKKLMQENNGYILHIDGTCDGNSPHIITVIDAISGFVLDSIKIATENSPEIIPMLKQLKTHFGQPLAVVSDMGSALMLALATVFSQIPHFICHFHFLRDIGKDLLNHDYDVIRKRLKMYKISSKLHKRNRLFEEKLNQSPQVTQQFLETYNQDCPNKMVWSENSMTIYCQTLIQWALKGRSQGQGYGFPFDRSYLIFYQRLIIVYNNLKEMRYSYLSNKPKQIKVVLQLIKDIEPIVDDECCQLSVIALQRKIKVFDELRKVMRLAPIHGKKGLNDSGQVDEIKSIEQGVKSFYNDLFKKPDHEDYKKMINQIKKYWGKLFADPIIVTIGTEKVKIQPQRTNNIMEQFFRKLKRIFIRKSGSSSIKETLKTILPSVTFINNLKNEQYMKILLKDKDTLEERFADIDAKIIRNKLKKSFQNNYSEKIQKITDDVDFPKKLMYHFQLAL
jgi:hypothetical protein